MKKVSRMLNGAGYTYVSGARIIATVLLAKNVRYSASASSTTCPWGRYQNNNHSQQAPLTSEYADENREIKTLMSTRVVTIFQK